MTGVVVVDQLTAANFFDFSGFTLSVSGNGTGSFQICGGTSCNASNGQREVGFRIHNIKMTVTGGRGFDIESIWGLLDHNDFHRTGSFQIMQLLGSGIGADGGFTPWNNALEFGTDHAVITEDNTFTDDTGTDSGEDVMDCYTGVRVTVRHSTFVNTHFGCHGTDSGSNRSMFSFEVYSNTFTNNTSSTYRMMTVRGGTVLYYNNTANGSHGAWNGISPVLYRACIGPQSNWQSCNGTNWELGTASPNPPASGYYSSNGSRTASTTGGVHFCAQNRDQACVLDSTCAALTPGDTCTSFFDGAGASGYACRDQPGRTHNQALAPMYQWLNSGFGIGIDTGGCSESTWVSANRDYYDYVGSQQTSPTSPFTGATGVGAGTLANRPTTCTTSAEVGGGVAYWATDNSTLYKCTATNTWTAFYTPFTYPDPLTGSSPVTFAPTSLSFGSQALNTTSGSLTTTMTNNQAVSLTGISISLIGSNLGDFAQSNNCGTSLTANASCTITATFTPTALGTRSASIQVADSATGSPQTVALSGTGSSSIPIITSTSPLPDGTVNTAYSQALTLSGGTSPYTCALLDGSLPTGVTLSSGCVISGTPTVTGVFDIWVIPTDSKSVVGTAKVLSLTINPASASVFYVNNSGSPACSDTAGQAGSSAAPWCTIGYAVTRITGGQEINVQAGTYTQPNILGANVSGSSGTPTIIRAANAATVTINCGGNSGRVLIGDNANGGVGVSFVTFAGFTVTNCNQGIHIWGSHDIVIADDTVHDVYQEGIHPKANIAANGTAKTVDSFNVSITNCTVYNTGLNTASDGEGVYIGTSSSNFPIGDNTHNVTVLGCSLHDTQSEGVESKEGTHDNTIARNVLTKNNLNTNGFGGASVELDQSVNGNQSWTMANPNHIVRDNICHDTGPGTGQASWNSCLHAGTGATLYNNIVYNINTSAALGSGGGYGIYTDNGASDAWPRLIYFNTVDVASARAIIKTGTETDTITNDIGPTGTNNLLINSGYFVSESGANYHLLSGTAPIGAGVAVMGFTVDHDGLTRPNPPAIGAYEFSSAGTAPSTSYSPTTLSFGSQNTGTTSASQTITLTNTGSASLTVSSIAMQTGTNFSLTTTPSCNAGCTVAVNGTVAIAVKFAPTVAGTLSDKIVVTSNAATSPDSLTVSGTGIDPNAVVFQSNGQCGPLTTPLTCTITSTPANALIVVMLTTLNGSGTYQPTSFTIADNVGNTYQEANGVRAVDNGQGTVSDIYYCANCTAGATTLTIHGIPTEGRTEADIAVFTGANTLDQHGAASNQTTSASPSGPSVTTLQTHEVLLSVLDFQNSVTGIANGNPYTNFQSSSGNGYAYLIANTTVTGSAAQWTAGTSGTSAASAASFYLSSGGTPLVTLSVTSLTFGGLQPLQTNSNTLVVNLQNTGNATLTISSIAASGGNAATDFTITANTCGASLTAANSCDVTVQFKPRGAGNRSTGLAFTTNAASSPDTVSLTGTATVQPVSFGGAAMRGVH